MPDKYTGPIMYISGGRFGAKETLPSYREWMQRTGSQHRCFSFAYVCPDAFYYRPEIENLMQCHLRLNGHVMMDSSGYSFHRFLQAGGGQIAKNKQRRVSADVAGFRSQTIKQYAEFCRKHGREWDWYVNFDYVRDCATIYRMQKHFEKMGLRPTPIFHGDSSLDWFRRYVDEGHRLIGIAGGPTTMTNQRNKRFYLDLVFNEAEKRGVRLHGFAMTSARLIMTYPWSSVDSSTWARLAGMGGISFFDRAQRTTGRFQITERAATSNGAGVYSRLPVSLQRLVRQRVEERGFDFDLLRRDLREREIYNAHAYVHLWEFLGGELTGRPRWEGLL